jgi:hypothetical protein
MRAEVDAYGVVVRRVSLDVRPPTGLNGLESPNASKDSLVHLNDSPQWSHLQMESSLDSRTMSTQIAVDQLSRKASILPLIGLIIAIALIILIALFMSRFLVVPHILTGSRGDSQTYSRGSRSKNFGATRSHNSTVSKTSKSSSDSTGEHAASDSRGGFRASLSERALFRKQCLEHTLDLLDNSTSTRHLHASILREAVQKQIQEGFDDGLPFASREELIAHLIENNIDPRWFHSDEAVDVLFGEISRGLSGLLVVKGIEESVRFGDENVPMDPGLCRIVRLMRIRIKAVTKTGTEFKLVVLGSKASATSSKTRRESECKPLGVIIPLNCPDVLREAESQLWRKLRASPDWQCEHMKLIKCCKGVELELQCSKFFQGLPTCFMTHEVEFEIMCSECPKEEIGKLGLPGGVDFETTEPGFAGRQGEIVHRWGWLK